MWVLVLSAVVLVVTAILVPRRIRARWDRRWELAERSLSVCATTWSVAVTVYVVFVPIYDAVTAEAFGGVVEQSTGGRRTFIEVNGAPALAALLLPVALTVLPWVTANTMRRRRLKIIGAGILLAFVTVGALSVGLLYAPSALAMLMAAALAAAAPSERRSTPERRDSGG